MKPIQTFGLAALAALAAMAFAGAPAAMASNTLLCSINEVPCEAANRVTHLHAATLSLVPGLLLNSVGDVLCDVLFLSTSVGALGAPQSIRGNFTYSGCVRHKPDRTTEACTVSELNGPATIRFLRTAAETAEVTGEGEMRVRCGLFINCVYNGAGLVGTGQGAATGSEENGSVSITNQETRRVSGVCPAQAFLDITFRALSRTYISS